MSQNPGETPEGPRGGGGDPFAAGAGSFRPDPGAAPPHEAEEEEDVRQPPQGLFGLMGELGSGFMRMLRDELTLAKLEARFALRAALIGLALILGAVALSVFALAQLMVAAREGLILAGLSPALAALALAFALLLIALALVWAGARKLRLARLMAPRPLGLSARDDRRIRRLTAAARDRSEEK